jgi:hypothetical protein
VTPACFGRFGVCEPTKVVASLVLAENVGVDGEDGPGIVAEILRYLVCRGPQAQPP